MPRRPLDEFILSLAGSQHGVFATRQAIAAGYSRRAVSRRTAGTRLHRLHLGVYAITPPQLLKPEGFRMAAVLACGPRAALSHRTAAAHHGLIHDAGMRFDVSIPSMNGQRRPGIDLHRTTTLRPEDVGVLDGVPTTTVARTLFDLSTRLTTRQLERMIDEAVVQDEVQGGYGYPTVEAELIEQIGHNRTRRRESTALLKILASRASALPTWNDIEERMLQLIRSAQLPDPEVQVWIDLEDGEPMIRPDFLWREVSLIVESDGFREHGKRGSFEQDRRRDQRAAAAGYETVRVTWRQLTGEPLPLTRRLQQTYRARAELFAARAA